MTEKLKTVGIDNMEYSIVPGAEIRHIAETCAKFTTQERGKIGRRNPPRELRCLAENDPMIEAPYSFENVVIGEAALVVVWSGNEVFNGKGEVRAGGRVKTHVDNLVSCMQQWRHCMLVGPGDSKSCGLTPRFDETIQRYIDCLDEMAPPRINRTRLYSKLAKRDTMRADSSEATMFATYQMTYNVVKWLCMASVIRLELDELITTLRLSGIPPARNMPDGTPASSDEEEGKDTRTVRFLVRPSEDVEGALISSASTEAKNNHKVVEYEKENERANSSDDESDDELRRGNRLEILQGVSSVKSIRRQGLARQQV